jgi:type VI secretion system secreted protein VgrG
MVHIPRIGQEVVVSFLEGDPDQPLIVGSVYNYDNMPPHELPDNKTKSGIVTRSSKGGDNDTYNGIVFEDKKDEEQIYVQAQYNMDRVVKNNDTLKIGFDKMDPGDQTIDIYNNRTTTLDQGNDKLTVKKGDREAVIEMGNDALTIKMGNQTTKLNLGKSSTEAMQSIEFKVGQSSLKIDQMGVTIKGMMISVDGQIQTQVKGMMTQLNGSAMLTVGGGLMMIG